MAATWPNIFAYEGIAWYASKVKGPGWLPIYRFFNTQTGTHFYSATPVERDNVIANLPQFAYEGIGYYIRLNGSLDSALVGTDANNNGVRDNVEQVLSRLVHDPASLQANVRVAAAYEKALSQPLPTNRDQAIELMGEIACVEAISGSDRIFESETFGLLPILFDTDIRVARWREWVRALEGGYSSDELPHCTQGIETRSQVRKSTNPFDNLEGQSDHQDRPVKVVFVNGIINSTADAKYSANHLASALDFRGKDDFSYIHFYNPTENFIRDNNELNFQAEQSWSASVAAHINEDRSMLNRGSSKKYLYYQTLGSIYTDALPSSAEANRAVAQTRLLAHRIATHLTRFPRQTLILVPHSQGNYYVEAAMGVLLHRVRTGVIQDFSEQQLLERVKVFGVATISATTWNFEGLDYVGLPNDWALNLHNALGGIFADSVPWNIRSSCDEGTGELSNHNFVKTYLSPFCTVDGSSVSLRDYVGTRIRDLFPTAVISLAPSVAQLNEPTTFSVVGIKLPSTAIMSIADAECLTPVNRTPTGFQQTCTPRGAAGTKAVMVKTNTDANGGVVIDNSLSVDVMLARFRPVPGYSAEECILDTSTGLIWEGKTSSGLRSADNTYTMANYSNTVWGEYIPTINGLRLCGRATWGLPTLDQIVSLFSLDESELSVLSGVRDDYYWTITSPGNDGNYVYVANPLRNVYTVVNRHGPAYRVRLVSAQ